MFGVSININWRHVCIGNIIEMTYQSRLETIREISLKTGKQFEEVMTIYTKIDSEIYLMNYRSGKPHQIYTPALDEEIAKLTEEECEK